LDGSATTSWQTLHAGTQLRFDAAACLPLRHRAGGCSACADSCPAGVIRLQDETLEVAPDCLGCGQCSARCPMGALAIAGFTVAAEPATPTVTVECWRVPAAKRASGAVAVPCLGGLTAAWLLEQAAVADGQAPVLLDRGWCADCPAGGGDTHPAVTALALCGDLMESMGLPLDRRPRLEAQPLPRESMSPVTPTADGEIRLSRRAFLGNVAGRVAERSAVPIAQSAPAVTVRLARPPHASRARQRLLDAVRVLAEQTGLPVPRSLFRTVEVSERCGNHQVCAATCPTGALFAWRGDAASGTGFAPDRCIDCGACERACPEQALRFADPWDDGYSSGRPRRLTRFEARRCTDCEGPFTARASDDTRCDACAKSQALVQDVFHQLFSTRPAPTASAEAWSDPARHSATGRARTI
jgi:ferredoxin